MLKPLLNSLIFFSCLEALFFLLGPVGDALGSDVRHETEIYSVFLVRWLAMTSAVSLAATGLLMFIGWLLSRTVGTSGTLDERAIPDVVDGDFQKWLNAGRRVSMPFSGPAILVMMVCAHRLLLGVPRALPIGVTLMLAGSAVVLFVLGGRREAEWRKRHPFSRPKR